MMVATMCSAPVGEVLSFKKDGSGDCIFLLVEALQN